MSKIFLIMVFGLTTLRIQVLASYNDSSSLSPSTKDHKLNVLDSAQNPSTRNHTLNDSESAQNTSTPPLPKRTKDDFRILKVGIIAIVVCLNALAVTGIVLLFVKRRKQLFPHQAKKNEVATSSTNPSHGTLMNVERSQEEMQYVTIQHPENTPSVSSKENSGNCTTTVIYSSVALLDEERC